VDLAINQSPRGLSFDIFDKFTQQEYACIDIICILHVHSNTYITAKLGIINCPFYRFLSHFSSKYFLHLSDGRSYCPFDQWRLQLKMAKCLLNREKFLLAIQRFPYPFIQNLLSGDLFKSPLCLCSSSPIYLLYSVRSSLYTLSLLFPALFPSLV
jgi:hypothetical protein